MYAVTAAELDGRPVVISGADDRSVRVWDLATGELVRDPFTGHTGAVYAVTTAQLDGRHVVISSSGDRTVQMWDAAKRRPMRHHFRRVRLRHEASVRAAALMRREDRWNAIAGCWDSVSQTWDLSVCRTRSRTFTPGSTGISAIAILAPDHVLYANGRTISVGCGSF